jgi:hypothetical protein
MDMQKHPATTTQPKNIGRPSRRKFAYLLGLAELEMFAKLPFPDLLFEPVANHTARLG